MWLIMACITGYGQQTIHEVAGAGNLAELKQHLQNGIAVNARSESDKTPLMWAVGMGHLEIAKLLVGKGADVNARDKDGRTPLTRATGNQDVVEFLKQHGAKE